MLNSFLVHAQDKFTGGVNGLQYKIGPNTQQNHTDNQRHQRDQLKSCHIFAKFPVVGIVNFGPFFFAKLTQEYKLDDFVKQFNAIKVPLGFSYNSDTNEEWETVESLRDLIKEHVDSNI